MKRCLLVKFNQKVNYIKGRQDVDHVTFDDNMTFITEYIVISNTHRVLQVVLTVYIIIYSYVRNHISILISAPPPPKPKYLVLILVQWHIFVMFHT